MRKRPVQTGFKRELESLSYVSVCALAQTGGGHPRTPVRFAASFPGGDPQTPQGNERGKCRREGREGGGDRDSGKESERRRKENGRAMPVRGMERLLRSLTSPSPSHSSPWLAWRETEPVGNWLRPQGSRQPVVHGRERRRMICSHLLKGVWGNPPYTLSCLRFIGVIMWLFRSDKYIMNEKALRPASEGEGRGKDQYDPRRETRGRTETLNDDDRTAE